MFAAATLLVLSLQAVPGEPPAADRPELRHLVRQEPSAEGPWGSEGFGWTLNSPRYRGVFLTAGMFSGSGLEMDAPLAVNAQDNGLTTPPLIADFRYEEKDFDATGLRITVDLDVFRLGVFFYVGDFDAEGTLTVNDGVSPPTSTPVEVDGDLHGFLISIFWPALRYRGATFEASLGPDLSVGWMHQEIDSVPGSPLPLDDTVDELLGTLGPRLSIRVFIGRAAVEVEAAMPLLFGATDGFTQEVTLGIGYKF